ncbi:MAG TPA: hypothetical protein VFS92_01000, partial [Planctomycetota bacterium]|nr:hypothetical protein [Planctomycetota bacterium]
MSDEPAPPAPSAAAATPKKKGWLRRWALPLVGIAAALAVAFVLFRGFVVRKAIETAVTRVTGFPLEIEDCSVGLTNARVEVTNLRLRNPPGFEDPRCLHASRIVAEAEIGSFWGDEFHAREIELVVPEIVVVKNSQGETNLDRLSTLTEGDPKKPPEEPAKERKWRCDRLHLAIGRVVFLDFTRMRDGKPKEEVWELDVDEEFRDLTNPNQIIRIIVLKVLAGTPIRLVNATVDTLREGLSGVAG